LLAMLQDMSLSQKDEPKQRKLTKEDKALAEKIQRLRREQGLSQEELSVKLGKHASYIVYIETGRRGLSLPMVYKLARILRVAVKELFDF